MKGRKTKKRNYAIILTIAVTVLAMASLTGCSKKPETQEASNAAAESTAETNVGETEKSTEEMEIPSESAPEQTVDSTPEPTIEPVVYEGIDMESDLPGEEWIQTFEGVVDEPVVTIYNDNTGRKEIIQEGSTVNVNPDEDKFAVFLPEGRSMNSRLKHHGGGVKGFAYYEIISVNPEGARSADEWENSITVTGGTEDWVVNFTMVVE